VVNASPLIVLAKAGAVELLGRPGGQVIVPQDVAREILAGPPADPARRLMESGWGERAVAPAVPASVVEWGLGAGESAVLALALADRGVVAILDDAEARACARTHGLRMLGTLGVILVAKQEGRVRSAAEIIRAIRDAGFRISDALVTTILRDMAGEEWP
jgi:predicted nucleic acid-binding protein